jgi:aminopeptidase YwaD
LREFGEERGGRRGSGLLRMTTPEPLSGLLAAVDPGRMTATVDALAGPEFAGRRAGSLGGAAARAWLTEQLTGRGARVRAEPFAVRPVLNIYALPEATWHDGSGEEQLVFGRQVMPHLASADLPAVVTGELGIAGEADLVGRWLLVPGGMSLFDAYGHAHGATGLLTGRATDADGWHYTILAGPDPGPLAVLTLDPTTHARMLAAAGTSQLSANSPIRRIDATCANVRADWERALRAGILLTAHYDRVGDHPGLRQPGASDNASGVAVVLEAARILADALPAEAGLSVALLDAEELGVHGSAHHAGQLQHSGEQPMVINVDGAGRLEDAAAAEAGGPAHRLLALLDQAGRHTGLPLKAGPVASDNRRYASAGFASVGIGAGMGGYHSPTDTPDRVDTHTLTAVCRLVVATVWLAATTPTTLSSLIGDKR